MNTIKHNGIELTLTQHAHISDNGLTYEAHATDKDGNDYKVLWDIIADDCDESNNCNWDVYTVKAL